MQTYFRARTVVVVVAVIVAAVRAAAGAVLVAVIGFGGGGRLGGFHGLTNALEVKAANAQDVIHLHLR